MNEILGLLLLTQWVKNLAKWVLVGRRLVAGRGALPVHLKNQVLVSESVKIPGKDKKSSTEN